MQQSEARKERVLVRPMSAGAPRQPTKAALSLGPSRPQSAWASLRHGAGPKEARGQLGLREKHAAMRGMAQLRESAVAGNPNPKPNPNPNPYPNPNPDPP